MNDVIKSNLHVALHHYVETGLHAKMNVLECMYVQQLLSLLEGLLPTSEDNKVIEKQHLERFDIFLLAFVSCFFFSVFTCLFCLCLVEHYF